MEETLRDRVVIRVVIIPKKLVISPVLEHILRGASRQSQHLATHTAPQLVRLELGCNADSWW